LVLRETASLSRGDDPEELPRRIADYRVHDKRDPEYYAKRTILKVKSATTGNQQQEMRPGITWAGS
jgi:hypothetical protein